MPCRQLCTWNIFLVCGSKNGVRSYQNCVMHFEPVVFFLFCHAMVEAVAAILTGTKQDPSGYLKHFYVDNTKAELLKFTTLYCFCCQMRKVILVLGFGLFQMHLWKMFHDWAIKWIFTLWSVFRISGPNPRRIAQWCLKLVACYYKCHMWKQS